MSAGDIFPLFLFAVAIVNICWLACDEAREAREERDYREFLRRLAMKKSRR